MAAPTTPTQKPHVVYHSPLTRRTVAAIRLHGSQDAKDTSAGDRRPWIRRHALGLIILAAAAVAVFTWVRSLAPDTEAMKQACIEQGGFGDDLISISEPDRLTNPPIDVMQKWGASELYFVHIEYNSAGGKQEVTCLAIPRSDGIQATIL